MVNLTVLILALEIFLAECDRGLNNLVDFDVGQFSCSLASFDGGSIRICVLCVFISFKATFSFCCNDYEGGDMKSHGT